MLAMEESKAFVHDEIKTFVYYMKLKNIWFSKDMGYSDNLADRFYRIYISLKIPFYVLVAAVCFLGLYLHADDIALGDGTIFNVIQFIHVLFMNANDAMKRRNLDNLLAEMDRRFLADEPWMTSIREKFTKPVWTFMRIFFKYNAAQIALFLGAPFLADLVLHRIFDVMDQPLHFPSPLSSFLMPKPTFGLKFYVVHVLGAWFLKEACETLTCNFAGYMVLSSYFAGEVSILRELLRGAQSSPKLALRRAVTRHVEIIKLHNDFKELAGFRIFGHMVFATFTLTLILFTCVTSPAMSQTLNCLVLIFPYVLAQSLHCLTGQQLQNEFEKLIEECYNIPWYEFTPTDRRSLLMMMRQAMLPMTMDYHGATPMNCQTLTEISNSIYSYLFVLKRMAD